MALYDLCQLADVKVWLGRSDSNSDAVLSALITRTSRLIYSYLQRAPVLPHTVTETRDGTGGNALLLRQWPANSISSLTVGEQTIPHAPDACSPGWTLEFLDAAPPGRAQTLTLNGYSFGFALPGATNAQNVRIAYQAGYQVGAEPQTVANGAATVLAPYGAWASDGGAVYASTGIALVAVASNPAPGQYALASGAPGSYVFNAADNGAGVLITYGYIPADLADACIELVGERFKYVQRIGEKTHSLGGNETVSFDTTRFTPLITTLLQPYRNVLPM